MDWYYIRRETVCVLQNYKAVLEEGWYGCIDGAIVLQGSPGMGKSSTLALMCLYIAVMEKKTVVWYEFNAVKVSRTFVLA